METADDHCLPVENSCKPGMSNESRSLAFPKSHRLLKRRDFLRVYEGGSCRTDRWIWIYSLDCGESRPSRVGITITRKVGKAVWRNKLRRRLREVLRHLRSRLKPGVDIVVNCGPKTSRLDYHQLYTRVGNLLEEARLLTNDTDCEHDQND